MRSAIKFTFIAMILSFATVSSARTPQREQLIKVTHPNAIRYQAKEAILGENAYPKNVRIQTVGATTKGSMIYMVTELVDGKTQGTAELVEYDAKRRYGKKTRRLSPYQARRLGVLTQDMARKQAQKQSPTGKFAAAKGELINLGTANGGKSFRFLQLLEKPIVIKGRYVTETHRALYRYVSPMTGTETVAPRNPEYKRVRRVRRRAVRRARAN